MTMTRVPLSQTSASESSHGADLVRCIGRGDCVARPGRRVNDNPAGCLAAPIVCKREHIGALLAIEPAAACADEQLDCARPLRDRNVMTKAVVKIRRRYRLAHAVAAGECRGTDA